MIDLSFEPLKKKTKIIANFIFFDQGRYILWLYLGVTSLFQILIRGKKIQKLIAFILGITTIFLYYYKFKTLALFVLFAFLIIAFYKETFPKKEQKLITFSVLFLFTYSAFSAANFLMLRYVLCLLPFALLLFIILFSKLNLSAIKNNIAMLFLAGSFIFFMQQNINNGWIDDASMNSFDMIKVHQEVVQTLEKEDLYDKKIFVHFLMWHNLTKPELKYLSSSKVFKNVKHEGKIPDDAEIIVFSKIELNGRKYDSIKTNPNYKLLQRFESNQAWSEIYLKQN
jgi:hypothetical protein